MFQPVKGKKVTLASVKDGVFSKKMLGDGYAIIPTEGKVYSPVKGKIVALMDSKHAYGIEAIGTKAEYLIHIGLDTVELEGYGFTSHVKMGSIVSVGELIGEFDKKILKDEKKKDTVMFVLTKGKQSETPIIK